MTKQVNIWPVLPAIVPFFASVSDFEFLSLEFVSIFVLRNSDLLRMDLFLRNNGFADKNNGKCLSVLGWL